MVEEIYLTYNPSKKVECVRYFNSFKEEFPYLENIELKFTPDEKYDLYNKDLQNINSGMPESVSLVDNRDLSDDKDEPVRLLLKDNFFKIDIEEQNEHILHELGHFFTNQSLKEIRKFILKNNPDQILIQQNEHQQLVDRHNKGLIYLWDIPKLPQEVNAELWINEKEPKYSESRLRRYCKGINTDFIETDKRKFFYEIPFINFHIIFRYSTLRRVDFDFKNECLSRIDKANKVLYEIADNVGWQGLKQLKYQDDILKTIEYKNEQISKLINLYEEIFEEYIQISSSFFPKVYQNEILNFYGFS